VTSSEFDFRHARAELLEAALQRLFTGVGDGDFILQALNDALHLEVDLGPQILELGLGVQHGVAASVLLRKLRHLTFDFGLE
jgi:hypothetical protein